MRNREESIAPASGWRPVPGYGGMYEADIAGNVRSWRSRWGKAKRPHMLTPYVRKPAAGKKKGRIVYKLTDEDGRLREVSPISLMVQTWMGGRPPEKVACHRNGDKLDNSVHNIQFITRQELGKKTGAQARRMPVKKINMAGQVVKFYPSARAAARDNHMSYQAVIDRCYGRVKKPFALDGHTYAYDEQ